MGHSAHCAVRGGALFQAPASISWAAGFAGAVPPRAIYRPADQADSVNHEGTAARFAADCAAAVRKTYKPVGDEMVAAIDTPPKFDADAAIKRLCESTILLVGRPMQPIEPIITRTLCTRIVPVDFKQLDEAYKKAVQGLAASLRCKIIEEA